MALRRGGHLPSTPFYFAMLHLIRPFILLALGTASGALTLSAADKTKEHEHHLAVAPGVQSLDVSASPTGLHLLTGELASDGKSTELLHTVSRDGGETWTRPVVVGGGQAPPFSAHRGADPQIAALGNQVLAVWMTAGTDAFGGGPMATALSADGGKTWTAGPNPADDGSTTGHGFIDVAADKDGAFHLTWLDTREGKRGLRYARSTDGGRTWSSNDTVDAETCECCWNTIIAGPGGKVGILYRDKEPRDMAVSWWGGAGKPWSAPRWVGSFQWEFQGCPHVGGGLASGGTDAAPAWHAVVWTGKDDAVGIHHLSSRDGGQTWSKGTLLAEKHASHADVAARGNVVVMACDLGSKEGSRIQARISNDGGVTWQPAAWLSESGRIATHPRVVAVEGGFRVFWTEQKGDGPVKWEMATLKQPADAVGATAGR